MTRDPSNGHSRRGDHPRAAPHVEHERASAPRDAPALDPIYDVPLVGRVIKEADALRHRLPFGERLAAGEADLLRMEARALRLAAGYLESRARHLDAARHEAGGEAPVRRIQIE